MIDLEIMKLAFKIYYDSIPDEMKYDLAINAYVWGGNNIAKVRKAVREALKYKSSNCCEFELPEELAKQKEIIVFRSGAEPIHLANRRISWTTDIEIAKYFFHNNIDEDNPKHLYTGKIKPKFVIAYYDGREEQEIMQYGHVYDVQEMEYDPVAELSH